MHRELECPVCGASEETILSGDPTTNVRPSRVATYMAMATIMAMRSTCGRGNVGVIATAGSRLIAGGYNGAPHGQDHCTAVGCDLSDGEEAGCQRAIHAEANLVAWAARAGVELEGATLYSTHSPCLRCAQLLAASRIAKFYFQRDYRLARLDILADAGVEIYKV